MKTLYKVQFTHDSKPMQRLVAGFCAKATANREMARVNQSGTGWSALLLEVSK